MNLKQKNKYIEDLIIKCYKLQQENQELKKLNIAQVRENAKIRNEKAKIEKQLLITKERIIEVLGSPLGKDYKTECNITRLKKLKEKIASEIFRRW